MSEKLKSRKLAPNYNSDQKWRNKVKPNSSSKRYEREFILQKYVETDSLPIEVPEDILILYEPKSKPSCLQVEAFSHVLGDNVNSRKFAPKEKKNEKTPEWFENIEEVKKEEEKIEEVPVKNETVTLEKEKKVEVVEEQSELWGSENLTNEKKVVDGKNNEKSVEGEEKKAKKRNKKQKKNATKVIEAPVAEVEAKEEKQLVKGKSETILKKNELKPVPASEPLEKPLNEEKKVQDASPPKEEAKKSIVPVYEKSLISLFMSKGNPFAKAMIQTGIESSEDKIYFPLSSKAYEKVWFYKDLEGNIQGPFNCIEMFNWTVRKCFPENLEISFCNTEFVPMNSYFAGIRKTASLQNISQKKETTEILSQGKTKESNTNPEISKKPWQSVEKPIGSLKDIQKEQLVNKSK